jgi:hypothetical protein
VRFTVLSADSVPRSYQLSFVPHTIGPCSAAHRSFHTASRNAINTHHYACEAARQKWLHTKEKTMNKKIHGIASMIMALALTLGTFIPGRAQTSSSVATFVTDADSRVHEANSNTNYGTYGTVLYVDGGADPDVETYLRFTVAGVSGTVTSAKLRVYLTEGSSNGPAVYATSSSWTETGITWNNRPARTSGALDDKGSVGKDIWVEYDVTLSITGNGTYSFILATDSTDSITLSAREGSFPAQLAVTTAAGAADTLPTSTPQATASPTPIAIQPTNTTISASPTAVAPTPTATLTSLSATQTPTQTVATATLAPTLAPSQSTGSGMWVSPSTIMSLPTSGAAWDRMRTAAYGSWGTPDLKNQDNKHDIKLLAGALVYARTGDASLRSKVRDGIIAAKRTLDASSEWQTTNGVLAAGRQLGAYVIAADLIALNNFDAVTDTEFRGWLTTIRTTNIGTHSRWKSITYTCENAAANWSTFACASRIAASIYLGDTADVDRAASIMRAFLGERSAYPANAPGQNGYFQHTAGYSSSWACDEVTWTGVNPACLKSGINIDGALVEDASRGGGCCVLQGDGVGYSWEALQGLFVSVELLSRTGRYGDPYGWSNQALKRAMSFMQRSGWGITSVATYVPWMANARYNTTYPTTTSSNGRIMSWGDWLYKK